MKNLICALFSFFVTFSLFGQSYSKEISYDMYEDDKNQVFWQTSGYYEYVARITWDYETKHLEIVNTADETVFFSATWKTEIHPDELDGDEVGRFIFDPAKNDSKVKTLKIYNTEDGSYRYVFEAAKSIVNLRGITEDMGMEGEGDGYVEEGVYGVENTGAGYYLNFSNDTGYDVYFSSYVLDLNSTWIQSEGWTKIEAGNTVSLGQTMETYFYYYAYCVDSKGEFLIWEGTDFNAEIAGSDGTYGFIKVDVNESGTMGEDGQEWYLSLTAK